MTLFRSPEVRTSTANTLVCLWVRTTDRRQPLRCLWVLQPDPDLALALAGVSREGASRCL